MVWGALRDRYFQNAVQLGALYVDVSNDTVDARKAKVEILPMKESGLALVRDAAHFVRIASGYWDMAFYANTALPSLAPVFPMIAVDRKGRIQIQNKSGYMMRLFGADGFHLAERWLREGAGRAVHGDPGGARRLFAGPSGGQPQGRGGRGHSRLRTPAPCRDGRGRRLVVRHAGAVRPGARDANRPSDTRRRTGCDRGRTTDECPSDCGCRGYRSIGKSKP